MNSVNFSKSLFVLLGFVVLIGYQNCAKTHFSPDTGAADMKSLGELEDPMDGVAEVSNEIPGEMPSAERSDEDVANEVVCIGNGIKVPENAVVPCKDGKEECVKLCSNTASMIAGFKQARSLIPLGAIAGDCP